MRSSKARKQRKAFFNAPLHQKRKHISAHLEENLLLKYDRRRIPVVKGDTVRIMRGAFKGQEAKVTHIYLKKSTIAVEGITNPKADGKKVERPIHPSNVMITKLNLTDKWRRRRLEQDLSEATRKEIETEAKKQIREREEEEERQRREAERLAAEEKEASEEEQIPEEPVEDKEEVNKKDADSEKEDTNASKPVQKETPKKKPEKQDEHSTDTKAKPAEKKQKQTEQANKKETTKKREKEQPAQDEKKKEETS